MKSDFCRLQLVGNGLMELQLISSIGFCRMNQTDKGTEKIAWRCIRGMENGTTFHVCKNADIFVKNQKVCSGFNH